MIYSIYSIVFPSVFELFSNKMESTCCRLFEVLKSIKFGLSPEAIIIDFEKSCH